MAHGLALGVPVAQLLLEQVRLAAKRTAAQEKTEARAEAEAAAMGEHLLALGRQLVQELVREPEPGFELVAAATPGPGAGAHGLLQFQRCCLPPKPTAAQPPDRQ